MRSLLEKAIVALLNEERETADDLIRQFMITKAQEIHEGLRQGDDALSESLDDDIVSEQYFTAEDFSDDVPQDDAADADLDADAADDLSTDMDVDGDDASVDGDDASFDTTDDTGVDGDDHSDESADERIDDLEAQLDELTAEFEKMMSELDGTSDDDMADDDQIDTGDDVSTDVDGDMSADDDATDDVSTDDDFDDIKESILDELEKITTPNTDGREQGNKSIKQNDKSLPLSQRDKKAAPIKTKQDAHVGFARETAPKSDRLPQGRNSMSQQKGIGGKVTTANTDGREVADGKTVKQNDKSPVLKSKK